MTIHRSYHLSTALLFCLLCFGCGDEENQAGDPAGKPWNSDDQAEVERAKGDPYVWTNFDTNKAPETPAPRTSTGLIDVWLYTSPQGSLRLDIRSDSELVFDGEQASYRRVGEALRVTAEGETVDYPIKLSGDRLAVTFPGGRQLTFRRAGDPTYARYAKPSGGSGLNSPRYLATTLMNFGSSTGVRSSYARTTRVTFDGQGRFVVRNETNFSSDAGGHHSNPVTAQGTYQISGQSVILRFSDGEKGTARIKMRQNDGSITELVYEGDLYGPIP